MITVEVYYIKNGTEYKGEISWDGRQYILSHESPEMRTVVTTPISVPNDEGTQLIRIWPREDPEQFMRKLFLEYKSYRWRISKPIVDD